MRSERGSWSLSAESTATNRNHGHDFSARSQVQGLDEPAGGKEGAKSVTPTGTLTDLQLFDRNTCPNGESRKVV